MPDGTPFGVLVKESGVVPGVVKAGRLVSSPAVFGAGATGTNVGTPPVPVEGAVAAGTSPPGAVAAGTLPPGAVAAGGLPVAGALGAGTVCAAATTLTPYAMPFIVKDTLPGSKGVMSRYPSPASIRT